MSSKVKGPSQKELFEARKAAKAAQDAASVQAAVAAKAAADAEKAKHDEKFAKEKAKVAKRMEKNKEFVTAVKAHMATMTADEIQLQIVNISSQIAAMERDLDRDSRKINQGVGFSPAQQKVYDELMLRRAILQGKSI